MKKHITELILALHATIASAQQPVQYPYRYTIPKESDTTQDSVIAGVYVYGTEPPSLYALAQERDALPPNGGAGGGKTLGIFRSERQAKTWTTIGGYTFITAGAIMGGKAEMHRMYHGTTRNGDTFHDTRDGGLMLTGLGTAMIGASVVIGDQVRPLEILWKAASAAILYRVTAEATYNATKPR